METAHGNIKACHIISAVLLLRHRAVTVHTGRVKGSVATRSTHTGGMLWTTNGEIMYTNQFVNWFGNEAQAPFRYVPLVRTETCHHFPLLHFLLNHVYKLFIDKIITGIFWGLI